MKEYWGSGDGIAGGGSGGGGGGGGTVVTLIAAENLSLGAAVSVNSLGEAQLADTSLALTPREYNAIGVTKAAALAGAAVQIYTDLIASVPMRFGNPPAAGDKGRRVYLSTTPGIATLTAPGAGNATYLLGILLGSDGVTLTPNVLLNTQLIAEIP